MSWEQVKILENRIAVLEEKIEKVSIGLETGLGSDFIFPGIRRGLEKKILNTSGSWSFGEGYLFSAKTNSNGNFGGSHAYITLNIDNERTISVRSQISGNVQQDSLLSCDLNDVGNNAPVWETLSGTIQGFSYTYNIPLHFNSIEVSLDIGSTYNSGTVILILL